MGDRLSEQIKTFAAMHDQPLVAQAFVDRLQEGALTRDENPYSHYCVYFAAYDPETGRIFVGHHIKSDLWLFNGGHIDAGETAEETLLREMGEEWGLQIPLTTIGEPRLLTITEIDNAMKQRCTRHYDLWYFVPVSQQTFAPDQMLLAKEYHRMAWLSPADARNVMSDANTRAAVTLIEQISKKRAAADQGSAHR